MFLVSFFACTNIQQFMLSVSSRSINFNSYKFHKIYTIEESPPGYCFFLFFFFSFGLKFITQRRWNELFQRSGRSSKGKKMLMFESDKPLRGFPHNSKKKNYDMRWFQILLHYFSFFFKFFYFLWGNDHILVINSKTFCIDRARGEETMRINSC